MLSVQAVKGIVLSGLFVLTFVMGLIPVKIIHLWSKRTINNEPSSSDTQNVTTHTHNADDQVLNPKFKRMISLLSCFAAGVFLATCFLDLLPAVRRTMVHVLYRFDIVTGYPVSEFIMVIGFFVILITEQIVLTCKETRACSLSDVKKPLLTNEDWQEESANSEHAIQGISSMPIDSHSHDALPPSSLRSLILLIALSLHSVFEGLAVGLQKTSVNVLGIFAALIMHKCILSFSLGLNLVQSKLSQRLVVRSVLIFSVSAPVGVGIGMGIINLWDSSISSVVQALLTGIATGTFLYVTFFEVLPHEFNSHQDRMLKVLFLIVGYSTVTGILFLSADVKESFCVVEQNLDN